MKFKSWPRITFFNLSISKYSSIGQCFLSSSENDFNLGKYLSTKYWLMIFVDNQSTKIIIKYHPKFCYHSFFGLSTASWVWFFFNFCNNLLIFHLVDILNTLDEAWKAKLPSSDFQTLWLWGCTTSIHLLEATNSRDCKFIGCGGSCFLKSFESASDIGILSWLRSLRFWWSVHLLVGNSWHDYSDWACRNRQ